MKAKVLDLVGGGEAGRKIVAEAVVSQRLMMSMPTANWHSCIAEGMPSTDHLPQQVPVHGIPEQADMEGRGTFG